MVRNFRARGSERGGKCKEFGICGVWVLGGEALGALNGLRFRIALRTSVMIWVCFVLFWQVRLVVTRLIPDLLKSTASSLK